MIVKYGNDSLYINESLVTFVHSNDIWNNAFCHNGGLLVNFVGGDVKVIDSEYFEYFKNNKNFILGKMYDYSKEDVAMNTKLITICTVFHSPCFPGGDMNSKPIGTMVHFANTEVVVTLDEQLEDFAKRLEEKK